MPGECPVCLNGYKDPASLPCGHVFCTVCIVNVVNAAPNGTKAQCPNCRDEFTITAPDLTYLPRKYHEYVMPSLRRVYLTEDRSAIDSLKKKLSASKTKLRDVEKECGNLRAKYNTERQKYLRERASLVDATAQNEEQAQDLVELERWGQTIQEDFESARQEHAAVTQKYSRLLDECDDLKKRNKRLCKLQKRTDLACSELSIENKRLSAQNQEIVDENRALSDAHNALQRKYQQLQEQLTSQRQVFLRFESLYLVSLMETHRVALAPSGNTILPPLPTIPLKRASSSRAKTIANPSIIRTRSAAKRENQSGTPSDSDQASLERVAKRPRI